MKVVYYQSALQFSVCSLAWFLRDYAGNLICHHSALAHFEGDKIPCPLEGVVAANVLNSRPLLQLPCVCGTQLAGQKTGPENDDCEVKTAHNQMLFNKFLLKGPRTWVKQSQLF